MTTALDLAPRPSSRSAITAEEELNLAALLQLFEAGEDIEDREEAATSVRASLRSSCAALIQWVRGSSRRAASWGALPGGWQ